MHELLWLFSNALYQLLKFVTRACLELLGCGVHLFYWSVRTYGWGKVASFLGAFCASLWLQARLGWLSLNSAEVK